MRTKTKRLPKVTRSEFRSQAVNLPASIGGLPYPLKPKEFATKSLGWHANGTLTIELPNGTSVDCSVNILLTVVGSKELPDDPFVFTS